MVILAYIAVLNPSLPEGFGASSPILLPLSNDGLTNAQNYSYVEI